MAKVSMINRDATKKFKNQHRNRCRICGRPRGYMGEFEICRILLQKTGFRRKNTWRNKS